MPSGITTLPDQPELMWRGSISNNSQGQVNRYKVCHILYIDNLTKHGMLCIKPYICKFLGGLILYGIINAKVVEEQREKNATYWHEDGGVWVKEVVNESLCGKQYFLPPCKKRKRHRVEDPDYEIYYYDQQLSSILNKIALLFILIIVVKAFRLTFYNWS